MPNRYGELTDEEIFGAAPQAPVTALIPRQGELSDEEVFGQPSGTSGVPEGTGPSALERFGANFEDSFRHGTLLGAGMNYAGQKIADAIDPEIGDIYRSMREQDRRNYENMKGWEGAGEGGSALAGQIAGAIFTPESAVALPAKVIAGLGRVGQFALREGVAPTLVRRGIEGAAVNAATDPAVQGINVAAGEQEQFDPLQAALAGPLGFVVGSGTGAAAEWRNISRGFRDFIGKRRNIAPDALDPSTVTPQDIADFEMSPDLRAALEANGVKDVSDPRLAQLEARLLQRRQAEAQRTLPDPNASVKKTANEATRLAAERDAIATGVQDPGAASTAGMTSPRRPIDLPSEPGGPLRITIPGGAPEAVNPPRPVPVTREGQAVVSSEANFPAYERMDQAAGQQQAARADVEETFRLADVQRRRGPEYQERRAGAEKQFAQDQHYESLTQRIGRDPSELAQQQLSIPPEQFRALPPEARERVVQSAQRQEAAAAPDPRVMRTSDAALSEGDALYNPSTAPTARVSERPAASVTADQPTRVELERSGTPYARSASGTSDRPFIAEDKNLSPEQARQFEDSATTRAEQMREATIEELERKWRERARAREGQGPRFKDAEAKWAGKSARDNFTNTPEKPGADKRYGVDDDGFVRSTKGGPVKFADQKMAARWIINRGHKDSPDQIFEIENHPSGKGFTVRERGRTAAQGNEQPAAPSATQTQDAPGSTRALPAPEGAGPPTGRAERPAAEGGEASRPASSQADESANPSASAPDTGTRAAEGPEPRATEQPTPKEAPANAKLENDTPAPAATREPDARAKAPKSGPRADAEPAKPQGTRETVPPSETGLKQEMDSGTSLGTTFYSTPFDPKLAKEMLGMPLMRVLQREKDGLIKELRLLKRSMAKSSPNRKTIAQAIGDFGRVWGYTNRGVMNTLRDRYPNIKEIGELADMLASQPGDGRRAIKETFNEVVDRRPIQRLQQALNMLDGKVENDAFMDRIGDILAGRSRARTADETAVSGRLRKLLDDEHEYATKAGLEMGYVKGGYFPRTIDKQAVLADPKTFQAAAVKVYQKIGLGLKESQQAAEDYYHRILGIGQSQYTISDAPTGKFTKGRALPKEADTLLKDFYVTDPVENLAAYFRQTTRRAEFARRFGVNGEKADAMFDSMLRQGMKPQDVGMLRLAFDSTTGNISVGKVVDAIQGPVSWIQTLGTMSLLPRAIVSSLAESVAVGVRSGSALDSLDSFFNSWRAAFGSDSQADKRAAAEALGIIGHAHQQMILAERFGGGMDSKMQGRLLTNFFNRTGLTGLTEGQRVAATGIGQEFVRRLLQDVTDNHRVASSKELLAELGIGADDIAKLQEWVGDKPSVSKMLEDSAEADMYRTAIARFVDESIQNPKAVDRPAFANHPVGRMMYSVMSFQYAFTRNVLMRTAKQIGKAANVANDITLGDRARLAGVALPFVMLMAAQMSVSRMREMVYNPDADKEKSEMQKRVLDISRSGITGALDPIINAFASVRYEKDLSNLAVGANLAFFLERITKLAGLVPSEYGGKNNPNTNNAEWAATRAAYQMVAVPLAHVALSLAPGGPALKAGYGAAMAAPYPIGVGTPQTGRAVADAIVGPRDVAPVAAKKENGRGSGRESGRSSGR